MSDNKNKRLTRHTVVAAVLIFIAIPAMVRFNASKRIFRWPIRSARASISKRNHGLESPADK